jgi:hypothetical protein
MIDIFAMLSLVGLQQTCTVEAFLYRDGRGVEHYDTAVSVACFRDDKRRLVPDSGSADGGQIASDSTIFLPLDTVCPVHSRVTLPADGRKATVVQVLRRDGGGLPTPDHLEILLA